MIYIEDYFPAKQAVGFWFSSAEDDILLGSIGEITKTGGCYIKQAYIWDCIGDLMLAIYTEHNIEKRISHDDKRIMIKIDADTPLKSKYYTPETLIKVFSKLENWTIILNKINKEKGRTKMNEEKFLVECPPFTGMEKKDTSLSKNRNPKRDYAHPLDSGIIKFLDNDMINFVFRQVVAMVYDSTYGPWIASGVMVSQNTYPEINEIVNECVEELGIVKPYVVISNAITGLNAATFGNDEEAYIMLGSFLVCSLNREQLKFVIGHECGHIAMGHVLYHSVVNIATMFASTIPVIGPVISKVGLFPLMAWSRRSEITADRAGLLCCGDYETARTTLLQIALPFMDAKEIDIDDYVANSEKYLNKGVLRKLGEYDDAHPIIPKRIHALDIFVESQKYYSVTGRTSPPGAVSDRELEGKIEQIIKIL